MAHGSMKLQCIRLLRSVRLLGLVDRARFALLQSKHRANRRQFMAAHPDIVLPPDALMYETYGKLDYGKYIFDGRETARELLSLFGKYKSLDLDSVSICEWGCGAARLLRHCRDLLDESVELTGTDYDTAMIKWASAHIKGIRFIENGLLPPIDVDDGSFDIVYAISVMTHLPADTQSAWLAECLRILKSGGLFFFTVHGDSFIDYLLPGERRQYDNDGYVHKESGGEGSKNYVSYTSPRFMREKMLKDCDIVDHVPGETHEQDMWVVRK